MKAGVLFFVIADVKDYLVAHGKLDNDGTVQFNDLNEDLEIARVIENSLKNHGVEIQENIDKVINALPLIVGLVIH